MQVLAFISIAFIFFIIKSTYLQLEFFDVLSV